MRGYRSVQESAVTELPKHAQGGDDVVDVCVPPLPFGPNERLTLKADGGKETATAAELGLGAGAEESDLYFHCLDCEGDEAWPLAMRAKLPLRNAAGEVVDRAAWDAEYEETNRGLCRKPISAWPSGRFPSYRLGEKVTGTAASRASSSSPPVDDVTDVLRQALSAEEWIVSICNDACGLALQFMFAAGLATSIIPWEPHTYAGRYLTKLCVSLCLCMCLFLCLFVSFLV